MDKQDLKEAFKSYTKMIKSVIEKLDTDYENDIDDDRMKWITDLQDKIQDYVDSASAKPPTRLERVLRRKVEARAEEAMHGEAPAALADAAEKDEERGGKKSDAGARCAMAGLTIKNACRGLAFHRC